MADTENREDQKISECLREAFGYSDDQLLKQLDQANETFKDVNFTGAEDRLMKRFLARKAELEKETASQTPTLVPQNESANTQLAEELPKKTVTVISEAEEKKKNEKKVIRFGKKKVLATAALVAVIAGMLGGTAIGKRNYFFRKLDSSTPAVRIDNNDNNTQNSELERAYEEIKNQLNMPVLKLGYYPTDLNFKDYNIYYDEAQIDFEYKTNIISFCQTQKKKSISAHYESDRKERGSVYNRWLDRNIDYSCDKLEDGSLEYETLIMEDNRFYYISGIMEENEYKKMLENLNFY